MAFMDALAPARGITFGQMLEMIAAQGTRIRFTYSDLAPQSPRRFLFLFGWRADQVKIRERTRFFTRDLFQLKTRRELTIAIPKLRENMPGKKARQ